MQAQESNATQAGRAPDRAGAVVLLERFRTQMLATARRYSADPHDAEDALQRTAEIVLGRPLTGTDDELCRWLRTTVKREALAIRRHRERAVPSGEPAGLPEPAVGPPEVHERAERAERLRVGAQALSRLKPQEVRCLVLKAEGFSYEEICAATGFSYTKVNRCLTEGRRAFVQGVASIESGAECDRVAPHLSRLADGEATAADLAAVRPHLRGCLACRATLRDYRTVPARVAALAPPAALATAGVDAGPLRGLLESLTGAAQHKTAALGERAHQAAELISGQKVAAVAASAAALAGGGAVTAGELRERAGAPPKIEARQAGEQAHDPPPAERAPPQAAPAPVTGAPPSAPPSAPGPSESPPPSRPARDQASPPPRPANEFAPEAMSAPATAPAPAPGPTTASAPAPAPAAVPSGGGGAAGGGGAGGREFSP